MSRAEYDLEKESLPSSPFSPSRDSVDREGGRVGRCMGKSRRLGYEVMKRCVLNAQTYRRINLSTGLLGPFLALLLRFTDTFLFTL